MGIILVSYNKGAMTLSLTAISIMALGRKVNMLS